MVYSESLHCCQIFTTHAHPTISFLLPCKVIAHVLRSWVLCYDIELGPQPKD